MPSDCLSVRPSSCFVNISTGRVIAVLLLGVKIIIFRKCIKSYGQHRTTYDLNLKYDIICLSISSLQIYQKALQNFSSCLCHQKFKVIVKAQKLNTNIPSEECISTVVHRHFLIFLLMPNLDGCKYKLVPHFVVSLS